MVEELGDLLLQIVFIAQVAAESAKGALAAGMNVLAVPDAFTDFQDFGGANAVCDSLKDIVPNNLFRELAL